MIEVESPDFNIKLVRNSENQYKTISSYIILVTGYDNGNAGHNFFDVIKSDNDLLPFYTLLDVAIYAEEVATFWKIQSIVNSFSAVTNPFDLSIIWKRFALAINSFLQKFGELDLDEQTEEELASLKLKYVLD